MRLGARFPLRAVLVLVYVLSGASLGAQRNVDSREKTEKVADVLAALDAVPGKVIADVGAGEGFYTIRIARAVAPTGRVTAVDVDQKVLDLLSQRVAKDSLENVDVLLGAFDDPKLAASTYDAVLVYNAYHEMRDHEPMRRAMFNALKTGGRLVVVEAIRDNIGKSSRDAQVKEHAIALDYVAQELSATGFEITATRPDFLPFRDQKNPGGFWMIIATKPAVKE
jgi:predicted methyltransferase